MPRPTRLRSARSRAGLRVDRFSSAIVDLDEVPDLAKHACNHRAFVMLDGLADLAEAERAERAAVLLALPDRATRLGYPNLGHPSSPAARTPREPDRAERPSPSSR